MAADMRKAYNGDRRSARRPSAGAIPRLRGADRAPQARADRPRPAAEPRRTAAAATLTAAARSSAEQSGPRPAQPGPTIGTMHCHRLCGRRWARLAGRGASATCRASRRSASSRSSDRDRQSSAQSRTAAEQAPRETPLDAGRSQLVPALQGRRRSARSVSPNRRSRFTSAGRLSGRAVVDLDVIRKKKSSGGWFDPTSYLTGTLPVTASGVLRTDGRPAASSRSSARP